MDRSKITVIAIVVTIAIGASIWSWVNLFQIPEYDPEKAEVFVDHFYIRCNADHPEDVCTDVIGHHHRRCFESHLEPTPPDETEEAGPVVYDRELYFECMDRAVDDLLRDSPR